MIKAVKEDDVEACCILGTCYRDGGYLAIRKNRDEAKKLFKKAADMGSGWGMYEYAMFCKLGSAERYLYVEEAHNSGEAYAMAMRCDRHASDSNQRQKLLTEAAESGNTFAQIDLSYFFWLRDDTLHANIWSNKAAHQGHPTGQFNIGSALLEAGYPAEAHEWVKKSANQHHIDALTLLKKELKPYEKNHNTQEAVFCFVAISTLLLDINKDVIKLIVREMWKTRNHRLWLFQSTRDLIISLNADLNRN